MISSNILYTQAFKATDDTTLSFVYTSPETENLGTLLTQSQNYLVLEDAGDFILNIASDSVPGISAVDGLAVFLVDDAVTSVLTGGGSQIYNPGLNLVTDTTQTSSSAVSGMFLIAALDQSGYFGLSGTGDGAPSLNGALDQFIGGTSSLEPGNIVLRTLGEDLSSFNYKGSIAVDSIEDRLVVDKTFNIFSIGFKRHLQDVVIYNRTPELIETAKTFNTGIPLDNIPQYFRIGFSYSGVRPMELKNITINGTIV